MERYIEERVNMEVAKKQQDQKNVIIEDYNKIRKSLNDRDFLDSIIELPPTLNFYIIKEKIATKTTEIDKITDYVNWYKYFYKVTREDELSFALRENFQQLLSSKYNSDKNKIDIAQINQLSSTTVELINNKSYVKSNPTILQTIMKSCS